MDKQIEEMTKEIARILFEDCLLNIGGSCVDCEWNGKETKEYDCQSLLVAKKLLEKYQPKIPEGAVVVTEKDREELNGLLRCAMQRAEKWEKLCGIKIKETRKETAEKFAERLKEKLTHPLDNPLHGIIDEICKEITGGRV